MRACGAAGSQYKHGSFGLSHAASRPRCRLDERVRTEVRVAGVTRQSRRKPCWYCEPNVTRDAVSAAPDVAAFDTPAVTHSECASPPLTGYEGLAVLDSAL